MRISKDKNDPDYKVVAHCCVVELDGEELEEWVFADEDNGVVGVRVEGWTGLWDTVEVYGKVTIFRPYGCEPERGT